jgi:predicted methyltransferase
VGVAAFSAVGCGAAQPSMAVVPAVPAHVQAVVSAPDRDAEDRALDEGRKPGELLAFLGVTPGMHVAELAAGTGYTTEILARAVGPTGVVYGQNSQEILDKFAKDGWTARIGKSVNKNVVSVVRPFEDPLPPEAKDLDGVVIVLTYHDTYWFGGGVDRAKMNAAVFRALKPGGFYGIVDHSGRKGTAATEVQTLHRIEEETLRKDVEQAGFKLAAEAQFLRHPEDPRDWNPAPFAAGARRGKSDRFVLKFVRP